MTPDESLEFSVPVDIATLPTTGRTFTIAASEEARERVAKRLDLQKVHELSATFDLKPGAGGVIQVAGEMKADVVQTCVVSLAPVPAKAADTIEVAFITEDRAARDKAKREKAKATRKDEEIEEILENHDPPDIAAGDRIDLGELAVVHLALALDPYPRAPGVVFDGKAWGVEPEEDEKAPSASPFAVLANFRAPSKKPK